MKHLVIYNKTYRELLRDFGQYLERVGYNKGSQTALPSCVQEFFHWLEQRGINSLAQVTPGTNPETLRLPERTTQLQQRWQPE
jgi:hypothetical protein